MTIDKHAEALWVNQGGLRKAQFIERAKAILLAVAREQREACQAALGSVRQVVVGGSGYIKMSEAAAAIRTAGETSAGNGNEHTTTYRHSASKWR